MSTQSARIPRRAAPAVFCVLVGDHYELITAEGVMPANDDAERRGAPLPTAAPRAEWRTVDVRLPVTLLERLDAIAKSRGRTRAQVAAHLLGWAVRHMEDVEPEEEDVAPPTAVDRLVAQYMAQWGAPPPKLRDALSPWLRELDEPALARAITATVAAGIQAPEAYEYLREVVRQARKAAAKEGLTAPKAAPNLPAQAMAHWTELFGQPYSRLWPMLGNWCHEFGVDGVKAAFDRVKAERAEASPGARYVHLLRVFNEMREKGGGGD